jgi:hypothetical protein
VRNLQQRFTAALSVSQAVGGDAEVLPMQLARAVTSTLGVDGAGLSVHGHADRRTPLGASDDDAAKAERLQFTAGTGPCLDVARNGWPVFAVEPLLRERWPVYHDLLMTHTPFRAVVSLPLRRELHGLGALDLYLKHPVGILSFDAFEAMATASLISDQLAHAAAWSAWTEDDGPAWMNSPSAQRRARVWMAMGMISVALDVHLPDALAVLRSFAYATDRDVDDVAADITSGRLNAQRLRADTDTGR